MCRGVMEVSSARATRLLVGVAGAALLGAMLSGTWSVHGQGLDTASSDISTSDGPAPFQSTQVEVLVTPTNLTIDEGSSGRYWLYLRSAPSADMTVVISAGEGVTVHPTEVKFTPTRWRGSQEITVNGVDDADANDGIATITHAIKIGSASEYLSVDVQTVRVAIEDDDDPGISTSPARMRFAEGHTGTIDVRLEAPPTADVTVSGTVSHTQWATIDPSTLTFTSTDWSTPQQFTVTATDDQVRNPWDQRPTISVSFASSSSEASYNGLSGPSVRVDIADDEATGACVRIYPERLYIPESETATFTISLCSKPRAVAPSDTPYVEMRIDAGGDVTVNPARIRFEESNWATGETVIVSASSDDDGANDEVTITISGASGSGPLYVGTSIDVVTTVIDDDTGGIINPIDITVPEGGQGYYQAAIISEPSGTVTISISTSPGVVTLSATELTITPSNWETPQYVIVRAAADSVTEDIGLQLAHTIGGSSVEYDVITLPDVMVTVADGGAGPTSFARADETDGTRLSWGPPPTPLTNGLRQNVYQYEIERSVDGAFAFLTCVDADSTSFLDNTVESDTTYHYRVRAVYYATDRCAALRDIELTSGTLVDNSAHGVWSDGDTIWVVHETDNKLFAYDLASGAAQAEDDITAHNDSTSVPTAIYTDVDGGLWGDATRIWTVTANHIEHINHAEEVGFVPYRKSDGAFLSSEVVQTSGDMRPPGYPGGVDRKQLPEAEAFFGDGSTFWAAGSGRDTLFAYNASTGERELGKDIVVPSSICQHDQVVGIWHDTSRSLLYLATQCSTKKLFALDLSDGPANAHHIHVHDVTLSQGHGTIKGFWSDGHVIWVSSNTTSTSIRDSLLAYPLHNNRQYSGWSSPPVVVSVEVDEDSITQTEATVTVNVSGANDTDVHMRYALVSDPENWTTTSLPGASGVESVEFPLTGLTSDR